MLMVTVVNAIVQSFMVTYTWLNNNLISPLLVFARGFEFAVIFISALLFFMISIFVLLRQAKRLPNSYVIEIFDVYGNKISLDGVRQVFVTHDAAESYARMYREIFGSQYKFRVVGVKYSLTGPASKNK